MDDAFSVCANIYCEKDKRHLCRDDKENGNFELGVAKNMNELINVEKFKENIGKAKEVLNTYFPTLKEEYLQLEKDQDKIK